MQSYILTNYMFRKREYLIALGSYQGVLNYCIRGTPPWEKRKWSRQSEIYVQTYGVEVQEVKKESKSAFKRRRAQGTKEESKSTIQTDGGCRTAQDAKKESSYSFKRAVSKSKIF